MLAETIRLHCSKNDFKTAQDLLGDLNSLVNIKNLRFLHNNFSMNIFMFDSF